jgi:nucleoside-diphosphate-sugar epimerase
VTRDRLLLTGATGLLGGALLPLLRAARPDRDVVVLVRRPEQAARFAADGVPAVIGDLSRPMLGIEPRAYAELTRSVTEIVHGAADVRFDQSLAESRASNLAGTRRILDLARRCAGLQRVAHVSSIFVNGYREGVFAEEPLPPGQRFVNSYQQAKYEAEQLVLDAMRDLPIAIYRLSLVVADAADGRVSQFNYFHHMLRFLPGSPLPMMPGEPDIRVDLVPNDWVAAALAHLYDARFAPASIRHLCAGPDASMRLADAIDLVCDVVERHPSNVTGRPMRAPRMVSLGEYNRFVSGCDDGVMRQAAETLGRHVRLLGIRQSHLNTATMADLAGSGIVLPPMRDYLVNTVEYCLATEWGKKMPAAATA